MRGVVKTCFLMLCSSLLGVGFVAAVAPQRADALSYQPIACLGYYSDFPAYAYLDSYANDQGYCPPSGMMAAANGYQPQWGLQPSVQNDYGKVAVRADGACTVIPDTGPNFDFQVPCKAHDYCYDLRKASFSGTVSDSDCDYYLYAFAMADCNDRGLVARPSCENFALTIWTAVSAPGVVTDPNPGLVTLVVQHSNKCAKVLNSWLSDNVAIQQFTCSPTIASHKFKIWPATGFPGRFHIRTLALKCADVNALNADVTQWFCGAYSEQAFKIQGSYGVDLYTVRSARNSFNWCWDIAASSTANNLGLKEYQCFETQNQRWAIKP
jgi:hypothetical protein